MEENVAYTDPNMALPPSGQLYPKTEYVPAPDTRSWYAPKLGCQKGVDPTEISRRYTFPDQILPRGIQLDPAPSVKICLDYVTGRPQELSESGLLESSQAHPQFAFTPRGPNQSQVDIESQLRRLDQPLTKMQAVIAEDAPLFRNTVQPPQPTGVRADVLNAANPIATIVRPDSDLCRRAADQYAVQHSGLRFNNTTRQDTQVYDIYVPKPTQR
jgi:hypothetical protein